ncbi:MAG: hypothetical protein MK209_04950 [Planctomycetes bacterium]|nr:hypothetical protein [Planctomycetota bacterium]
MSEKFIDPRSGAEQGVAERLFRSESARDLFTTIYKRRTLYWTILVVFAAAFYFLAMRLPEKFTATARVRFDSRLEREVSQDEDNPERYRYRMMTAPDVAAEIQLFQAREVRARVAENPEVFNDTPYKSMPEWDERSDEQKQQAWMRYLFGGFSAQGIPNTNLVVLKFEDWSAQRAAMLANLLGEAYVAHRTQPSEAQLERIQMLRIGRDEAQRDFRIAIGTLDEFRKDGGLSGSSASDEVFKLQDSRGVVSVRLAEAQSALAGLDDRYQSVSTIDRERQDLIKALPEIGSNNLINSLEDEIRLIRARYNQELLHSTDLHAPVILLKQELDDANARHETAVQSVFEGLLFQLQASVSEKAAEVQSFSDELGSVNAEISRLADLQPQLDELLVEYESKREALQLAQKRLSAAENSGAQLPEVIVSLAGQAAIPNDRTMPPPMWLISVLAIALGLFLALTTVFVAGYLDRTLDTPGEAERELGLPVLATIQNERGFQSKRRKRR